MKYINILLIALVAFLFFAPDDIGASIPTFTTHNAGPMSMYFSFASLDKEDGGGDVVECQCGGDGDVGDGRIRVPCPCVANGGTCKCPKEGGAQPEEPAVDLSVEDTPKDWTYAYVFTDPSWCTHCVTLDNDVFSKLGDDWKTGEAAQGYVHIVYITMEHPLFEKYKNKIQARFVNQQGQTYYEPAYPSMMLVRNGQIKWTGVGMGPLPKTPEQFTKLFLSVK